MSNFLITGGPVHAYLDDVKLITNRFKGGLMTKLAGQLTSEGHMVDLLRDRGNAEWTDAYEGNVQFNYHDGFDDYYKLVKELSANKDAVILGAAVANLIPAERIKGKFPSHNYKPGDRIPIDFVIAPRVVDEVKNWMRKDAHLFAFKLLSGSTQDELIHAAYDIILHSRATTVFANDRKNLNLVYAVTKERGVHPMMRDDMPKWIQDCVDDKYYKTVKATEPTVGDPQKAQSLFHKYLAIYWKKFPKVQGDYTFGTIAIRDSSKTDGQYSGFFTTRRGKDEMDSRLVRVENVYHTDLYVVNGEGKASLNAPLLDNIFKTQPAAEVIVHYHEIDPKFPILPYAPPGTVRDSLRNKETSFNIEGHGVFLLLNKDGQII
jgi:hypothetical protein